MDQQDEEQTASGAEPPARQRVEYRWVWPLAAMNASGLILACLGALQPSTFLALLFPQIWGFSSPFGATLGGISIVVILITAIAWAAGGVDPRDRAYQFFAGLTLASSIMFALYLVGVAVILGLLTAAFGS